LSRSIRLDDRRCATDRAESSAKVCDCLKGRSFCP
jgi:hypothetical protein